MRLSAFIVLVATALTVGACGSGNSTPAASNPSPITQSQAAPNQGVPGQPIPLEGNWATLCLHSELISDKTFYREQYTFNMDRSFTHTRATYSEPSCSTAPTETTTIYGSFQPGNTQIQAKLGRLDATRTNFNSTRAPATGIELVINSPADSAGKFYSVFSFIGQSMYFGELPYDEQPDDRGKGFVPVVDASKEFRRQ